MGRIRLIGKDGKFSLDTEMLKDIVTLKLGNESIENDTNIGIVKNSLKNEKEIEENFNTMSIQEFFEDLENKVDKYYMKG